MKKVLTIGGGNGHSNMLKGIRKVFLKNISLTSVVSMSDDGRTTGVLMKLFQNELGIYFPPPGDLRKCLYSLSQSKYKEVFEILLETKFRNQDAIDTVNIQKYFSKIIEQYGGEIFGEFQSEIQDFTKQRGKFYDAIKKHLGDFFDYSLPLTASIEGHKMGNLLMANISYHQKSFSSMMQIMHTLLKVDSKILPVTLDKAVIQATTENGEFIHTQEAISDIADYSGRIVKLELDDESKKAYMSPDTVSPIQVADYIIIAPGDLYTSTIANFIIGGVAQAIQKSPAKIIFVANNTNKGGETYGYNIGDFVNEVEKYLGRKIDYLVVNNQKVQLSLEQMDVLKSNISVQGGDYIYLNSQIREDFQKRGIILIEAKLIDEQSLYKHDRKQIGKVLEEIICKKNK